MDVRIAVILETNRALEEAEKLDVARTEMKRTRENIGVSDDSAPMTSSIDIPPPDENAVKNMVKRAIESYGKARSAFSEITSAVTAPDPLRTGLNQAQRLALAAGPAGAVAAGVMEVGAEAEEFVEGGGLSRTIAGVEGALGTGDTGATRYTDAASRYLQSARAEAIATWSVKDHLYDLNYNAAKLGKGTFANAIGIAQALAAGDKEDSLYKADLERNFKNDAVRATTEALRNGLTGGF